MKYHDLFGLQIIYIYFLDLNVPCVPWNKDIVELEGKNPLQIVWLCEVV